MIHPKSTRPSRPAPIPPLTLLSTPSRRRPRLIIIGAYLLHDTRRGELTSHADQPLYLSRKGSDEPEFNFRGYIDDMRIYNRALSGDEILQLYGEG